MILPLAFILAIALTIWFVFVSDASLIAKLSVAALFLASWWLRFSRFSMAGFLIQVGLSIFIAVYLKVKQT